MKQIRACHACKEGDEGDARVPCSTWAGGTFARLYEIWKRVADVGTLA